MGLCLGDYGGWPGAVGKGGKPDFSGGEFSVDEIEMEEGLLTG